jgi:hypothetical protein
MSRPPWSVFRLAAKRYNRLISSGERGPVQPAVRGSRLGSGPNNLAMSQSLATEPGGVSYEPPPVALSFLRNDAAEGATVTFAPVWNEPLWTEQVGSALDLSGTTIPRPPSPSPVWMG